jgi:hypothetical protein
MPESKILGRHYMMEEIKERSEPIYIEDLKIDEIDIIYNGIAEDEKAEELLRMLLDLVHKEPRRNTKKELLASAEEYSTNKLKATFRKVRWLR